MERRARLLEIKLTSFATSFDAANPLDTVLKCAYVARDSGYNYFAVQHFGICRTGVNIATNYDDYGEAAPKKCVGGVGASYTNYVYKLKEVRWLQNFLALSLSLSLLSELSIIIIFTEVSTRTECAGRLIKHTVYEPESNSKVMPMLGKCRIH